ncbi:MAG: hypothetical protein AMXMBFR77_14300 [Phycisphaerales bacterium]|nr:hypothetical protein [Leptolyngbya sp.]GIK19281.1 MAG: hypothetical protein BroJett004_14450 [Planctomycetota bacterium]
MAVVVMLLSITAASIMFTGCQSTPGDTFERSITGPGFKYDDRWTRDRKILPTLPQGWVKCEEFTARGIPICIFCSLPGAPSHPDIPDGCVLVDLKCDGGPFEVWCGTVVPQNVDEYTALRLRFIDPIGPTLDDDGRVQMLLQVHQDEVFPPVALRGTVGVLSTIGAGYSPGGGIPAESIVDMRGTASDLAFNLYYLGFDRLAFTNADGSWELVTLKYLCEEAGAQPIDLPLVFLTHNGVFYDEPYEVTSE